MFLNLAWTWRTIYLYVVQPEFAKGKGRVWGPTRLQISKNEEDGEIDLHLQGPQYLDRELRLNNNGNSNNNNNNPDFTMAHIVYQALF